jgi:hypothetical protein
MFNYFTIPEFKAYGDALSTIRELTTEKKADDINNAITDYVEQLYTAINAFEKENLNDKT